MSSKKGSKKGSKKVVRAARKPTELNKDNVAKVEKALKVELKKDGVSKCEAIRAVAKRFSSVRRIEVEAAAVKGCKMNLGTVRRQIQEARA